MPVIRGRSPRARRCGNAHVRRTAAPTCSTVDFRPMRSPSVRLKAFSDLRVGRRPSGSHPPTRENPSRSLQRITPSYANIEMDTSAMKRGAAGNGGPPIQAFSFSSTNSGLSLPCRSRHRATGWDTTTSRESQVSLLRPGTPRNSPARNRALCQGTASAGPKRRPPTKDLLSRAEHDFRPHPTPCHPERSTRIGVPKDRSKSLG